YLSSAMLGLPSASAARQTHLAEVADFTSALAEWTVDRLWQNSPGIVRLHPGSAHVRRRLVRQSRPVIEHDHRRLSVVRRPVPRGPLGESVAYGPIKHA